MGEVLRKNDAMLKNSANIPENHISKLILFVLFIYVGCILLADVKIIIINRHFRAFFINNTLREEPSSLLS